MIRQRGFTFIEVLVSLSILMLVASLCAPLWAVQHEREKQQQLRVALREIRDAIDAYHFAYQQGLIEPRLGSDGYPRNLKELVDGVPDVSRPDGHMMYFLRRIPFNPYSNSARIEAHWEELPYRETRFGNDEVFDVHAAQSRSTNRPF